MSASPASSTTLEGDIYASTNNTSNPQIAPPRDRSPDTLARIRVKNRRKRFLDTHSEYFSPSLELAGLHFVYIYPHGPTD